MYVEEVTSPLTSPWFHHETAHFRHQSQALVKHKWGPHLMVSEGGETLYQSFVMLNSITLKPHCPEESICDFKLRHNVTVRLRRNRFAIMIKTALKHTPISPWNCSLSSPITSTCEAQWGHHLMVFEKEGQNIASIFCNAELHNLETSLSRRSDLRHYDTMWLPGCFETAASAQNCFETAR
jgi:hypothetical protein